MRHAGRPYLPLTSGAFFLLLSLVSLACTTKRGAASADRGALCADVGEVRACWDCEGGKPCLVGPALTNTRRAAPFVCQGGDCVQRHPRLPDDAEWECIDQDGAVVCRGGEAAAGVIPGPPEVGWFCGTREQGLRGPEKVCVDFAPDRPEGAGPWKCRSDHKQGEKRVCKQAAPKGPQLGEACGNGCPTGATCVSDRCVPAKPQPTCWFDNECNGGVCRQGTCGGGA